MNYTPTVETTRAKLAIPGKLFACDEVQVVMYALDKASPTKGVAMKVGTRYEAELLIRGKLPASSNRERITEAIGSIQHVASDPAVGPTALGYLNEARAALENAAQHNLSTDEG